MTFSLKKYSTLIFVLIGIFVLYIVFNTFSTKESLKGYGESCNNTPECDTVNNLSCKNTRRSNTKRCLR
jgi:hypothetical protein